MGDRPAIFLKGHGIALAARSVEEMLYSSLILEDEATKHVQASSLGGFHCFADRGECVTAVDDSLSLIIRKR